eukprot:EG_transcript_12099
MCDWGLLFRCCAVLLVTLTGVQSYTDAEPSSTIQRHPSSLGVLRPHQPSATLIFPASTRPHPACEPTAPTHSSGSRCQTLSAAAVATAGVAMCLFYRARQPPRAANLCSHSDSSAAAADGVMGPTPEQVTPKSRKGRLGDEGGRQLFEHLCRLRRRLNREPTTNREILCMDVASYLASIDVLPGDVVASLPDVSEMSHLNWTQEEWKRWFVSTVEQILCKLPPDRFAIFLQSDIKVRGDAPSGGGQQGRVEEWVDKGFLCSLAAHNVGAKQLWHHIELLGDVATSRYERASYSHALCFTHSGSCAMPYEADVHRRGPVAWARGMGVETCSRFAQFLLREDSTMVVHLFSGSGTMVAVANFFGLPAVGVEISPKRCRQGRLLMVESLLCPSFP